MLSRNSLFGILYLGRRSRSDRKTTRKKRSDEEVGCNVENQTRVRCCRVFTKHKFSVVPRSLFDSQGKLWR